MVRLTGDNLRVVGIIDEGIIQVAGDQHQVANLPVPADAPGGVGDNQSLHAHPGQQVHRQGHRFQKEPFVIVESSPGHQHRHPVEISKDQFTDMAGDCQFRVMRNAVVGDDRPVGETFGELTQTGAENNSHYGSLR